MSEILYVIADTVPVKLNGVRVLVLMNGLWYLNVVNEPLFIADVYRYGHVPRKLYECTGFDYEQFASVLDFFPNVTSVHRAANIEVGSA